MHVVAFRAVGVKEHIEGLFTGIQGILPMMVNWGVIVASGDRHDDHGRLVDDLPDFRGDSVGHGGDDLKIAVLRIDFGNSGRYGCSYSWAC